MKRLILTRHAKSNWGDATLADHDRPLNERGRGAAADLGAWLGSRGYIPGEVLCSDALRTWETWSGVEAGLKSGARLKLKPNLYNAGPDVMLAVLRHAEDDVVMMLAHNPGISEFAARILAHTPANPEFSRYPTGATLVVDFEIDDWAQLAYGSGVAEDFTVPREIA